MHGVMIDITERKRAEEAQRFLMHELDHRVKNVLATVQAVSDQTSTSSGSIGDFRETFRGRIDALARIHDLIGRTTLAKLSFSELVRMCLDPFSGGNKRICVAGDPVDVPIEAVRVVGMLLHELATNATKYGALKVPEGGVDVSWQVESGQKERRLRLRWEESGGPPVAERPRRGFGRTIIEDSVPYELDGEVRLEFRVTGVRCEISFPITMRGADG